MVKVLQVECWWCEILLLPSPASALIATPIAPNPWSPIQATSTFSFPFNSATSVSIAFSGTCGRRWRRRERHRSDGDIVGEADGDVLVGSRRCSRFRCSSD